MKKSIYILSLAIMQLSLLAQTKLQPDSVLIYSFSPSGDSVLVVIDARKYDANGRLDTRKQRVYEDYIIFRTIGEYNAVYSYIDNGNEKITTITYLNNNGDTNEREIYTYKDNEMEYLRQMLIWDNVSGSYRLIDYWRRIYKGIRNYEYTGLFEIATGSYLSIYDVSELPLYHADTILFEMIKVPKDNIWETIAQYVFHYNQENIIDSVIFTSDYRVANEKYNFMFFYNEDKQCVKIEYFDDVIIAVDSVVRIKNYEIIQTLNENGQPIAITYYTVDSGHYRSEFNYRWIYAYDNEGNILSETIYEISDTSDIGYPVEKKYYIYNSPSSIKEHNRQAISIFPNPAQSQFTVTNTEDAAIYLYNILGQEMKQVKATAEQSIIYTDNLPAGMYVLKVVKDNISSTHKIQIIK